MTVLRTDHSPTWSQLHVLIAFRKPTETTMSVGMCASQGDKKQSQRDWLRRRDKLLTLGRIFPDIIYSDVNFWIVILSVYVTAPLCSALQNEFYMTSSVAMCHFETSLVVAVREEPKVHVTFLLRFVTDGLCHDWSFLLKESQHILSVVLIVIHFQCSSSTRRNSLCPLVQVLYSHQFARILLWSQCSCRQSMMEPLSLHPVIVVIEAELCCF